MTCIPPMGSRVGPFSSPLCFCPSYVFHVASSLHLAMESLLSQSFGSFLGFYTDVDVIWLYPWKEVSLGSFPSFSPEVK